MAMRMLGASACLLLYPRANCASIAARWLAMVLNSVLRATLAEFIDVPSMMPVIGMMTRGDVQSSVVAKVANANAAIRMVDMLTAAPLIRKCQIPLTRCF